jgi:hypothetical protein
MPLTVLKPGRSYSSNTTPRARSCLDVFDLPRHLGAAALSVSAGLLGAYIITQLNFPLFYEPGTGVAQLEVMLRRWALLNYVRVCLGGAALVVLFVALVCATRSARTTSARDGVQ